MKRMAILGLMLALSACHINPVPENNQPTVLGAGLVAVDDSLASQDLTDPIAYSDITISNVSRRTENQFGDFKYFGVTVTVANNSGSDIDNLTLVALAVPGLFPGTSTATLNPLGANRNALPEEEVAGLLAEIVPQHRPDGNFSSYFPLGGREAFVAFPLSEVTEPGLISSADAILNLSHAEGEYFILPYGFRVGDVAAGNSSSVDLAFRLPITSPVDRFSFAYIAIADGSYRITQGVDEIALNNGEDVSAFDVEERFIIRGADKLVFIGDATREISDSRDNAIANALEDVRIGGGFAGFEEVTMLSVPGPVNVSPGMPNIP